MEGPLGDVVVPALKSTFMRTTTMSNHNYESRKATPWTGKENASDLEKFIDRCNHANYEKRHPCVKGCDEIAFLNSCIPVHCPHCGSDAFVRRGLTGTGLQRYMCKECHKTFTVITGTIFDQRKIPMTEWIDFLLSIMGYGSFHLTSRNNKNSATTTKYWLEKVFLLLRHRQEDIVLQGRVYLDETYIPVKGRDARRLPVTTTMSSVLQMGLESHPEKEHWKQCPGTLNMGLYWFMTAIIPTTRSLKPLRWRVKSIQRHRQRS